MKQTIIKYVKTSFLITTTVIGLSLSAHAQGTLNWTWTYQTYAGNTSYTGSGTLTTGLINGGVPTDPESGGSAQITAITGTFNGSTITSLLPVNSFDLNDNTFYNHNPQVDGGGLSFSAGGVDYNIFLLSDVSGITEVEDSNDGYDNGGDFWATLAPVPEPSTLALAALGGLSGLAFIRRRK